MRENHRDLLWLHLRELPYFRSLMRAVEAGFYAALDLPGPTLDLGCGDGHFVTAAFERQIEVGLDPWFAPLRQAQRRGGYRWILQADGARMPFPDGYFASAFSNSVLEHIPHLEEVLREVARVLRPGAPFVFCGPNHTFLEQLSISRWLEKRRLPGLAAAYRRFFNRISRHYHSDSPEVWLPRLQACGFTVERWWHYFPPQALQVMEWGHYWGLPSLVAHTLTGRWILAPQRWNLRPIERWLRPIYAAAGENPAGVCTFYVARRASPITDDIPVNTR